MRVFFTVPEFDGQLLRALSYAPAGGADLGECLTTAARIKEGDFDSWYQEWTQTAEKIEEAGEHSLEGGHTVSARQAFLRASNYYRASYHFLGGAPLDERVKGAYAKHASTFDKAARLLPYACDAVAIPYGETTLPGYHYRPQGETSTKGTILTFTGYDGTHQECYFSVAKGALDRGFNVLCFDGPGQGELLINRSIYMTHEWEKPVGAAIVFLRSKGDENPIVVFGSSWGGMLAPLAAVKEHRIAALIASPGQYEALIGIKKALPNVEELLREDNHVVLDQILTKILADKMVASKFKYKMWVHGVDTALDLLKQWTHYSLKGEADKIQCPTLVVDYENEPFSAGQAHLLYDALTGKKDYLLFKNTEGAGEHCGVGALSLTSQRLYDWVEDTLNAVSLARTK